MPQLANDLRQIVPFDKTHRVKVSTAVATHREDRHNIGMLQLCCCFGFVLKPLQTSRIQHAGEGQDF
jgi:hypothetical protein